MDNNNCVNNSRTWIRERIKSRIAAYGCYIATVVPDTSSPPWTYTVGAWERFGAPELVIFGYEHDAAGTLLDCLIAGIRAGKPMPVERGVLPFLLRPLHSDWRASLPLIPLHYGDDAPVPVFQVCWPDDDGRLPGDVGFAARYDDWQPLAWMSKAEHPASVWLG